MNIHKYARLTPYGRAILVRRTLKEGLRVAEVAHACGATDPCGKASGPARSGSRRMSAEPSSARVFHTGLVGGEEIAPIFV